MTVDEALKRAKTAQKNGDFREADSFYTAILKVLPQHPDANFNLGIIASDAENPQLALRLFKSAIEAQPNTQEYWNKYIETLLHLGNVNAAIAALRKAENYLSKSKEFRNLKDALVQKLIDISKLLILKNQKSEALTHLETAYSIDPHNFILTAQLGLSYQQTGDFQKAINTYHKALKINPASAEIYNNMAAAKERDGHINEAMDLFKQAIRLQSNFVAPWINGAEALERWNKLDELKSWLEASQQKLATTSADLQYIKALLHWRLKENDQAMKLLEGLDIDKLSKKRLQAYYNLKGKCLDAKQKYAEAYTAFKAMNHVAVNENERMSNMASVFIENAQKQLELIPAEISKIEEKWENRNLKDPTFLVGFPRSGTTLLESLLKSHSKITVVEEKPTISATKAFLTENGFGDAISKKLPATIINKAKSIYVEELKKYIENPSSEDICIDKMPLNLLEVPLINTIFPRSKYILAIRHPMDAILSCWMQNFKLNAAMANFTDLERTVDLYCIAMQTFKKCRQAYGLPVHQVRYEDVVEDIFHEATRALEFLELSWENQMHKYREQILASGRINTPSYSQVTQPVYTSSRFRWINYRYNLQKYLEKLNPWIEEFNYAKI